MRELHVRDWASADPVAAVTNLSRSFGSKTALNDVTLTVPRGCVFGLVGENGAGKSTLIKHLLGLWLAETGSVRNSRRWRVRRSAAKTAKPKKIVKCVAAELRGLCHQRQCDDDAGRRAGRSVPWFGQEQDHRSFRIPGNRPHDDCKVRARCTRLTAGGWEDWTNIEPLWSLSAVLCPRLAHARPKPRGDAG